MHHFLKCWPMYFYEVKAGRKTFEVRSTKDRIFQAGDTITLQGWNPLTQQYLGEDHTVDVLAVYHNLPGLALDHCVMSLGEQKSQS